MFDDEWKLFTKLKYDNKNIDKKIRDDRDKVLYFLKDFNIPATKKQNKDILNALVNALEDKNIITL